MSWQTLIILQIFVSSLLTIWSRHVSLKSRKSVLAVGLISYFCIAVMGLVYSLMHYRTLPSSPPLNAWVYLFAEGMLIPLAWVFQFKLISYIGASNSVISHTLNTLGTALLGILLLGEALSIPFIIGTVLIIGAIFISLNVKPDADHPVTATLNTKIVLLVGAFICFSFGMFFEKQAIGVIGAWNYSFFGWSMQLVGATVIYAIFGRGQLATLGKKTFKNSVTLGLMTSIAGILFVLALSKGSLSQTVMANSGKIAITMLLAAIFLHERNNMPMRIGAFWLATLGIFCIMI